MQEDWKEAVVHPNEVLLDWQNPRIEATATSSQPEIRSHLVKYEKVIALAKQIIHFGGLMQGERIIVTNEHDKYVVLEGNRRICAVQLLLEPSLVPAEYKKLFPHASEELMVSLLNVKADVAPNRAAAEPVITRRHTEKGIEPWTPAARVRRAGRLFSEGRTIGEISSQLGATDQNVKNHVREHNLIERALKLATWSPDEREALTNPSLKTNPFTRFFTLGEARSRFGFKYNDQHELQSNLSETENDDLIAYLVRCFLLPAEGKSKPAANTRTPVQEVLKDWTKIDIVTPTPDENHPEPQKPSKKKTPAAKASIFFEKITCSVQDDRLIALSKEISMIEPSAMPISGFFLLRASLEACLEYKLRKTNQVRAFKAWAASKGNNKPGLSDQLTYCATKANSVFIDDKACDALHIIRSAGIKNLTDFVIHGNWIEANESTLMTAAAHFRPLIQAVMDGSL